MDKEKCRSCVYANLEYCNYWGVDCEDIKNCDELREFSLED